MEKTNGSITSEYMGGTKEEFLFTYSESEKQEHEINENNAELVLNPKFIPLYPKLLQNGYGLVESILLGFIDFFIGNGNKFYCTNEQLAKLLNCSEKTISTAMKSLESKGDIVFNKKMRAGGGTVRFVTLGNVNFTLGEMKKVHGIDNKIIKNKKIPKESFTCLPKQDLTSRLANTCKGDLTFTENVIERLEEYNNTRKKKLEKLTDKGFKLVIDKLVELGHGTEDGMIAVLKQSVEKGWEGLFEVKGYKPKVDYEKDLGLFLTRLKTDYEGLKKELGNDKFFELKKKALEYGAVNKLL